MKPKKDPILHIHVLDRHVPGIVSDVLLALFILVTGTALYLFNANASNPANILITSQPDENAAFTFGSWPALQNAEFFQSVKKEFIAQKASFIEADLTEMAIRYYDKGELATEAAITTKGRDGSWWETPAGLYQITTKEKNHFSSFGQVYMPWSMQFQGNFFIHGPTAYPDGTPTPSSYSGGCIRIAMDDAEALYAMAKPGTPVLVFEHSFTGATETIAYEQKQLLDNGAYYVAADLENNFVFAQKKSGARHSIASITKLVAALVAVEYINVEKEVTVSASMLVPTSIPRLYAGEQASVLDLLSLLLMESSNEAASAITAPLGSSRFIELMNKKANAIGMKHSRFVDTSGSDAENISTAEDLFALSKYLYHNRSFLLRMTIGEERRGAYDASRYGNVSNLNAIPGTTGMVGGKMGLSTAAGETMLAVYNITIGGQERPIAIIILGSQNAKEDARTILTYIKNSFSAYPRAFE
jgi:D-alanyl-D-alanine carboxypeptidase